MAEGIDEVNEDDGEGPLCVGCLRPVSASEHYCPNCGHCVGQMTAFLPYEGIRFRVGLVGSILSRFWQKKREPLESDHPGITFDCEECGRTLTFPGSRRGNVETCPHCQEYVDVPE